MTTARKPDPALWLPDRDGRARGATGNGMTPLLRDLDIGRTHMRVTSEVEHEARPGRGHVKERTTR